MKKTAIGVIKQKTHDSWEIELVKSKEKCKRIRVYFDDFKCNVYELNRYLYEGSLIKFSYVCHCDKYIILYVRKIQTKKIKGVISKVIYCDKTFCVINFPQECEEPEVKCPELDITPSLDEGEEYDDLMTEDWDIDKECKAKKSKYKHKSKHSPNKFQDDHMISNRHCQSSSDCSRDYSNYHCKPKNYYKKKYYDKYHKKNKTYDHVKCFNYDIDEHHNKSKKQYILYNLCESTCEDLLGCEVEAEYICLNISDLGIDCCDLDPCTEYFLICVIHLNVFKDCEPTTTEATTTICHTTEHCETTVCETDNDCDYTWTTLFLKLFRLALIAKLLIILLCIYCTIICGDSLFDDVYYY